MAAYWIFLPRASHGCLHHCPGEREREREQRGAAVYNDAALLGSVAVPSAGIFFFFIGVRAARAPSGRRKGRWRFYGLRGDHDQRTCDGCSPCALTRALLISKTGPSLRRPWSSAGPMNGPRSRCEATHASEQARLHEPDLVMKAVELFRRTVSAKSTQPKGSASGGPCSAACCAPPALQN